MDTYPITARSLGLYFKVDGNNLERAYKDHLSGFRNWEQASHAEDWVLHPKNIGKRLGIDETMLHKDLMTFLTNKEGHGKRHTLIAAVKGTKASDIINVLMQIPQEQRELVEEVTMDFSDSMFAVVTEAFPNAAIVIDCFHIVKRCIEAVDELRLKAKREAQKAVSIRPTTGIKPLYTTIATVTMNLIVSAAIVLLNPYVTVYISYKIPPFALSVHIPDVSTSIYVEVDSKVLLGLLFCDKAFVR